MRGMGGSRQGCGRAPSKRVLPLALTAVVKNAPALSPAYCRVQPAASHLPACLALRHRRALLRSTRTIRRRRRTLRRTTTRRKRRRTTTTTMTAAAAMATKTRRRTMRRARGGAGRRRPRGPSGRRRSRPRRGSRGWVGGGVESRLGGCGPGHGACSHWLQVTPLAGAEVDVNGAGVGWLTPGPPLSCYTSLYFLCDPPTRLLPAGSHARTRITPAAGHHGGRRRGGGAGH